MMREIPSAQNGLRNRDPLGVGELMRLHMYKHRVINSVFHYFFFVLNGLIRWIYMNLTD